MWMRSTVPPNGRRRRSAGSCRSREIDAAAARLIADIPALSDAERRDELVVLRRDYLKRQLEALRTRVRMLQGAKLTFDEESQALYDAVAPVHPESYFAEMLQELERLLPGDAPLVDRYDAFRQQVHHPVQPARARLRSRDRRVPRAHAAARAAAGRTRASPSSTSRTSRGAATTGIRATIAA